MKRLSGVSTNWQNPLKNKHQFKNASRRHYQATLEGEIFDKESKLYHKAHRIVSEMMDFWHELKTLEGDVIK